MKNKVNELLALYKQQAELAEKKEPLAPTKCISFRLSLETIDQMEDIWINVKRIFRFDKRIYRHEIMRFIIATAYEDMIANGKESALCKRYLSEKE